MNSHLPNMRLLTIPSQTRGEDWFAATQKIDEMLEGLSMDLAEEAVYLIFSDSPGEILEGGGQCLVARSVIGPKKTPAEPLGLIDWKASAVWMEKLGEGSLEGALLEAQDAFLKLRKEEVRLSDAFFLKIERRLKPELVVSIYAIFHE